MSSVAFASVIALFRATLSSPDPLFTQDPQSAAPRPVPGVWAALPPDCAAPSNINLADWPKCATPLGFLDDEVAALQRPRKGDAPETGLYAVARTKYVLAPGDPLIVQIDVTTLFSRSSLYIALTPDGLDALGRFKSATGWPVGCPTAPVAGITQDGPRCTAQTPDGVRSAAQSRPDSSRIYRLVRIQGGADDGAPSGPPPATSPETSPETTPERSPETSPQPPPSMREPSASM